MRRLVRGGVLTKSFAILALLAAQAAPARAQADVLRVGTLAERHRAVIALLTRPSAQRTPAEWAALVDELRRVRNLPHDGSSAGAGDETPQYFAALAAAVGQSRDPAVVPLLIDSLDAGLWVLYALPAFGDAAIDSSIDAVRTIADPNVVDRLLWIVGRTVQTSADDRRLPLTDAGRARASAFARELWKPGPLPVSLTAASDLALATGDPALRDEVLRLTRDLAAVMARAPDVDPIAARRELAALVEARKRPPLSTVDGLRSGDDAEVKEAADRLLYSPSGDVPRDTWKAASDATIQHARRWKPRRGDPDADDPVGDELAHALTLSSDPIVIPGLIAALNRCGACVDPLVRFGDQAVPGLIQTADDADDKRAGGALLALGRFLLPPDDAPPLSDAARQAIAALARTEWRTLRGRRFHGMCYAVFSLVLSTGDPALRDEAVRLANDSDALKARGIPGTALDWVQPGLLNLVARYEKVSPR